ncbi:hypothetical protein B0I08_10983 [Glaciihabitans tibetensis]|uniref:Uncharacterized protein n=1 Tax=Glaciihabitans tibetensis TaxID=1266600 RepID=A0A2T0V6Y0_9MICO|nr:hypothetical protein B0I08_10983 [Glaciihabitans tibetensis]
MELFLFFLVFASRGPLVRRKVDRSDYQGGVEAGLTELTDPHAVRMRVRPKSVLSRLGVLTFLITIVPLFGVLYWYTAPYDVWTELLAVQGAILVGCLAAYWRQTRVFSSVSAATLKGNGIFSPTAIIARDTVSRVVLVPVYRSHPSEANTQLIALTHDDGCVFRMRGQFWHASDLTGFAAAIGRPVTVETTAISEKEFFHDYPGSAYWFEKGPGVRLVVVLAIVAVVSAFVIAIMSTVGRVQ